MVHPMRSNAFTAGVMPAALALVLAISTPPPPARANEDRVEARQRAACTPTGEIRLRVRGEDGRLRVDVSARLPAPRARSAQRWRAVVVHERRTVLRRTRSLPRTGRLAFRVFVGAYAGANSVRARLYGPAGRRCVISAAVLVPLDVTGRPDD
jgi:hypothetical protein